MITEEKFREHVGRPPERDDLERCNCAKAGEPGHFGCGWCEHKLPVFECTECFIKVLEQRQMKS